jgi:hypothetical protein
MRTTKFKFGLATAIALIGMISAASAPAQSLWLDRSRPSLVSVQFLKPIYDGGNSSFATAVGYLDARANISESLSFVGEAQYSAYDAKGSRSTSFSIGNPYAGLELRNSSGTSRLEVGVRFPFAVQSEGAALVNGAVADISRFGAFLPETYVVQALGDFRTPGDEGPYLRARLGPQLATPENGNGDSELFGQYALIGGYETASVRVGAGLVGVMLLSEENLDFSERTIHQLQLNADFGKGTFRPSVFATLWLDEDLRDDVPLVVGFGFNWGL